MHRWRTQQAAIRDVNCRIRESSNLWTHTALLGNWEYVCLRVTYTNSSTKRSFCVKPKGLSLAFFLVLKEMQFVSSRHETSPVKFSFGFVWKYKDKEKQKKSVQEEREETKKKGFLTNLFFFFEPFFFSFFLQHVFVFFVCFLLFFLWKEGPCNEVDFNIFTLQCWSKKDSRH